jgi:hypothetical protein
VMCAMIILAPEKLGKVDPPRSFRGPASFSAPVPRKVQTIPTGCTMESVMRIPRNDRYGAIDLCDIFTMLHAKIAQYCLITTLFRARGTRPIIALLAGSQTGSRSGSA